MSADAAPGPGPGDADLPLPSVCLVVLDGWGLAPPGPGNAISLAQTPTFDGLWSGYPHAELDASGRSVGLPDGQMGNSEVGHLNLGAGAVVRQDLTRIDDAIEDGSFDENEALLAVCAAARQCGRLHLLGLVSDGGVHSGFEHLEACIRAAADEGVPDLVLHAFTDGRDTLPQSGRGYLETVEGWLERAASAGGSARVGSVSGRYYAMDRDGRWDRTQLAYDAIVHGRGPRSEGAAQAIQASYDEGVTDEFILPTVVAEDAIVRPGDAVLMFNFRPDRARQMARALGEPDFDEFDRGGNSGVALTTMTEYRHGWAYPVAFPPEEPEIVMAEVIAQTGARQLHVAETEKYAHVTYFFNGGREQEQPGEERRLVPSPKDVATYDHKPAMSARAAADAFVERWGAEDFRFGIINFANPDMVGHTGVIPAAVEAVETVDSCLAAVVGTVHERGGACIVTADHGNCDQMLEPDGSPNTAHSTNPVPLIVTVTGLGLRDGGVLADVSPTVLALLGIPQPPAMTARSLLA